MALQHIRNFEQTLAENIDDTVVEFDISDASLLPSSPTGTIPLTIDDGTNLEIVYYVSKSTNTITVTRGEEGTSGTAFNSGTPIECRFLDTSVDNKADGAASSTDNAFARFDATTGKILQNSQTTEDDSGNVTFTGHSINSITAGITASTTQTQGQQALTKDINEISTVANENDTVTLPTAVAGKKCVVINNGANTLQIFPASGDDLGQGANTATTLAAANTIIFIAYDGTNWEEVVNTSASAGAPTEISFRAYSSGTQSLPDSSYVKVNLDTTSWNVGGYFNTTDKLFSPPAGKYAFVMTGYVTSIPDGATWALVLYKNGSAYQFAPMYPGKAADPTSTAATVADLNGTDEIEFYVVHVSPGGGSKTLQAGATGSTSLVGWKIGD